MLRVVTRVTGTSAPQTSCRSGHGGARRAWNSICDVPRGKRIQSSGLPILRTSSILISFISTACLVLLVFIHPIQTFGYCSRLLCPKLDPASMASAQYSAPRPIPYSNSSQPRRPSNASSMGDPGHPSSYQQGYGASPRSDPRFLQNIPQQPAPAPYGPQEPVFNSSWSGGPPLQQGSYQPPVPEAYPAPHSLQSSYPEVPQQRGYSYASTNSGSSNLRQRPPSPSRLNGGGNSYNHTYGSYQSSNSPFPEQWSGRQSPRPAYGVDPYANDQYLRPSRASAYERDPHSRSSRKSESYADRRDYYDSYTDSDRPREGRRRASEGGEYKPRRRHGHRKGDKSVDEIKAEIESRPTLADSVIAAWDTVKGAVSSKRI